MALVSPGTSIPISNESFYIPVTAPTLPLIVIATCANKTQLDGTTPAIGSQENNVVRTITSLSESLEVYGLPKFRVASGDENLAVASRRQIHGDPRNEYGLLALNQFLQVASQAYVIRANVDLNDTPVPAYSVATVNHTGTGNGTISATSGGIVNTIAVNQATGVAENWTLTATNTTTFTVVGSISGPQTNATVGTLYNNGIVSFFITAGGTDFVNGDTMTFTVVESIPTTGPLGTTIATVRANIVAALESVVSTNQTIRSEIYEYNLIVCPGYSEVTDDLLSLANGIEVKGEAFVIGSVPMDKDTSQIVTWAGSVSAQGTVNGDAAYWYPHAYLSNLDGSKILGCSSSIALKTIGYSDSVSEVWMAPAGAVRGAVTGVDTVGYVQSGATLNSVSTFKELLLNQGQRDSLYTSTRPINPIAFFPGYGLVVWGQKTSTSAASALDRINVSRLLKHIRRGVRKGSFPYIFEPNDQITRGNLKSMVDGFLGDILIKRGLYDYATLCSEFNNTATRIDRNELYCDIALKPTKAAEFLYFPTRIVSTSATI